MSIKPKTVKGSGVFSLPNFVATDVFNPPEDPPASGTFGTGLFDLVDDILIQTSTETADRNGNELTIDVTNTADVGQDTDIWVVVTGTLSAVLITVHKDGGAGSITTSQLASILNNKAPDFGIGFFDDSSLITGLNFSGGGEDFMTQGGEGDGATATITGGS